MKKMKISTRTILVIALSCTIGLSINGCSKNSDVKPSGKKIVMKITVTAIGVDNKDQVTFGVSAGNHDASQYGSAVWKINGTAQGNQNVVFVDTDEFLGTTKTYILETTKGFDFGSLDVTVANLDGTPITLSYKTETNGVVETNVENVAVVAGTNYHKDLQYVGK